MLLPVYVSVSIAFLFYLLLPALGALRVAATWRAFRRRVSGAMLSPVLDFAAARAPGRGEGPWRVDGRVEAIEGTERLWVRTGTVSVVVDFSRAPLYVLARREPDLPPDAIERAGGVERLRWSNVRSLAEGARLFVAGGVAFDEGHPVFHNRPECPLLVVLHDEEEDGLESTLVAAGRVRNEIWSRSTFLFWTVGLALSSLLSSWAGRSGTLDSIRFLSWLVTLSPLLPFFPPGTLFFMAARRAWRTSLHARMRRDLGDLSPAEHEPGSPAQDPRATAAGPVPAAVAALGLAVLAYAANFALAMVAWRLFY